MNRIRRTCVGVHVQAQLMAVGMVFTLLNCADNLAAALERMRFFCRFAEVIPRFQSRDLVSLRNCCGTGFLARCSDILIGTNNFLITGFVLEQLIP